MIRLSRVVWGTCLVVSGVVLGIASCEYAHASEPAAPWEQDEDGVVINHNNAEGTADQRAINFCQKRGSERLTLMYNGDTITVVCRDDPQTSYTFVR